MEPRITILLANYNYGKYIASAIESALKQTCSCSLCIVDDCSTDDSWEVIHKTLFKDFPHSKTESEFYSMKSRDKVIAIRLKKNVGPSEARNCGIELTINNTDAYLILDADDEAYPEKAKRLLETMLGCYEQIGAVYADYDVLNTETGNLVREYKEPFDKLQLLRSCIVHSGSLVNSNALRRVKDEFGYYDRNMRTCEDYCLWLRISEQFIIFHVPEPLSLVRVTPNNSTATVSKQIWNQNWQRIRDKYQARSKFN